MNTAIIKSLFPKEARIKGIFAALGGTVLISFDSVFVRLSGTGGVNTAFLFGLFTMISISDGQFLWCPFSGAGLHFRFCVGKF